MVINPQTNEDVGDYTVTVRVEDDDSKLTGVIKSVQAKFSVHVTPDCFQGRYSDVEMFLGETRTVEIEEFDWIECGSSVSF